MISRANHHKLLKAAVALALSLIGLQLELILRRAHDEELEHTDTYKELLTLFADLDLKTKEYLNESKK